MNKLGKGSGEISSTIISSLGDLIDYAGRLLDNIKPLEDVFTSFYNDVKELFDGLSELGKAFGFVSKETDSAKTVISILLTVVLPCVRECCIQPLSDLTEQYWLAVTTGVARLETGSQDIMKRN